ncbi:MAG TPA: thioredoxin, partial [Candidatus Binatia bacterium]|nr:thioredoxin [Candidatus Binatia bacterium]
MTNTIIHVSDENFETEVLKSPLPVLLDLWAPW